jgi:hypothetical protein
MKNQVNDQQDEELEEATKGLEPQDGSVQEEKFEDIGEIKPEEPQVPEVDLQPLPKGLKYEFLGPDKTYPVIVSDELSPEENEKLLILLKKHRKVIGYSINDLKGLSPAFCTHRIQMEDQCKPIVDHQRRITHAMREVPKKGGLTVVRNEKNEISKSLLCLLSRWVLGVHANSHSPRRSTQKNVYMPLWNVCK